MPGKLKQITAKMNARYFLLKKKTNPLNIWVPGLQIFFICLSSLSIQAQNVTQQLQQAFSKFEKDSQLEHAISSLFVIEASTGKVVFDKNSKIGLVPASTQKVMTSAAALAILGKDFKYITRFAVDPNPESDTLYIFPSGDPTLGSERWEYTKAERIMNDIINGLMENSRKINTIVINNKNRDLDEIPDGWVWQDIGNYYGASAQKLNWRENQYDVLLRSGKNIGDPVSITGTNPKLYDYDLHSLVTSAAKGTGDKAYIYFNLKDNSGIIKGTIPVNENGFGISGAFRSGALQFAGELAENLIGTALSDSLPKLKFTGNSFSEKYKTIHTISSPPLDSIIYWFNQKSINLYGEAILKTISAKEQGIGISDSGVTVIKDFWKQRGISDREINIVDGSGLSPLNRVTTHSQVAVLQYAYTQPWFNLLFRTLPTYNGIKMKSGTIKNVKGFTGIHQSGGKIYIFSFLINNYNGSASTLIRKMYTVLDVLK